MKGVCLFFGLHQPLRLRRYRFFDIGNDHYYYDDYTNETILRNVSEKCYLPANKLVLELIRKYKDKFKVSSNIKQKQDCAVITISLYRSTDYE